MTQIRSYAIFEALRKGGNDLLNIIDKRIEDDVQL